MNWVPNMEEQTVTNKFCTHCHELFDALDNPYGDGLCHSCYDALNIDGIAPDVRSILTPGPLSFAICPACNDIIPFCWIGKNGGCEQCQK